MGGAVPAQVAGALSGGSDYLFCAGDCSFSTDTGAAQNFWYGACRRLFCAGECSQPSQDGELELFYCADVGGEKHSLSHGGDVGGNTGVCDCRTFQ